jgi:hypothetical protein
MSNIAHIIVHCLYISHWWIFESNLWSLIIEYPWWDTELSEIDLIDCTEESIIISKTHEIHISSHDLLSLPLYLNKRTNPWPLIDHELNLSIDPPDLSIGFLVCLLLESHHEIDISHMIKI